jgi:hypothetical protein
VSRLRDRLVSDGEHERERCKACHGRGLISPDSEPPPDDEDFGLSVDEEADLLGVPPLPSTVRHPERMSPRERLALRLFPTLESCG